MTARSKGPEQDPSRTRSQEPDQEDLSRHVTTPRLRVAPPAELAEWADGVITKVLALIRELADAARPADPRAEGARWGNMARAMSAVGLAAEAFGRLGDLDLLDYQRARGHPPERRPARRVPRHLGQRRRSPDRVVRQALPGRLEHGRRGGLRGPG